MAPATARDGSQATGDADLAGWKLRPWSPPELPEQPYPVLLPYTHPRLLAGRERERAELAQRLRLPIPILGLYAGSGAGKSSLLLGGLVPTLRDAGQPVAVVRHPAEPGLAGRLIDDLLETDGRRPPALEDVDHDAFVEHLRTAHELAGTPPVLIVDQFEDLFHGTVASDRHRARALAGALLAASVQRQPGREGPLCHWLLAYRQEFHGKVVRWLGDVLREARELGLVTSGTLPHDLSGPDRFHSWSLKPLGLPPPNARDPVDESRRIFQAVIDTPLALRTGTDKPRYPWTFADDSAHRLAKAFAEARLAQPRAPLVPELQVVLAHLLARAVSSPDGSEAVVEVPEEPGELIHDALEEHLRRALAGAFPSTRASSAKSARTRAILALRELADAGGQRNEGLVATELARAIGHDGHEVLEKLATPQTRIVVAQQDGEEWVYVLSHDRMAEVVVRLVDEEVGVAAAGLDAELLRLRRFVALKSELLAAGETELATAVPRRTRRLIEEHAAVLLWGAERQRWWQACRAWERSERRRFSLRAAGAALIALVTVLGVWRFADRRARRAALFEQVSGGEPELALAALDSLAVTWGATAESLRAALREREQPLDVLERGIGGLADEDREVGVLRAAELILPLTAEGVPGPAGHDPERIASLVWALDFFAPQGQRTQELRDLALESLRRVRAPPPLPPANDPQWVEVPAGTYWMGSGPGDGRDEEVMQSEWPKHQVTLSAFRLGTHEVTNAEFWRLYPDHHPERDESLPAVGMTWHEAYTYAAWIGGRLPTEAEWEYAARAGCPTAYCRRDGGAADVGEVAWWQGNATDPTSGDPKVQPVGQREPNPWGLFDIFGNVWEFNADWLGMYRGEPQVDPPGPTGPALELRVEFRIRRGGSVWEPAAWVGPSGRGGITGRAANVGLRVALPVFDPSP